MHLPKVHAIKRVGLRGQGYYATPSLRDDMASGVLFAMVCPMLEDELIFSMDHDPEPRNLFVLDTPYKGSFVRKLEEHSIPYSLLDEGEFMSGESGIDRSEFNIVVRMKNLGLHREPAVLKQDVEDDLRGLDGLVDAAALYYGMCGNFGWDPEKWADGNLGFPVRIFRDTDGRVIDDCVGVAVGGLKGYQRLLHENTGCMLFTPAIATNWLDFLSASDMMAMFDGQDDVETTKKNLKDILEMCNYHGVTQIDTGYEDRAEFDRCTRDFADYNNFEIRQCSPDLVDLGPAKRLYSGSKALLE